MEPMEHYTALVEAGHVTAVSSLIGAGVGGAAGGGRLRQHGALHHGLHLLPGAGGRGVGHPRQVLAVLFIVVKVTRK